jgi:hypothetical protein
MELRLVRKGSNSVWSLGLEDHEFEASLDYTARPSLSKHKTNTHTQKKKAKKGEADILCVLRRRKREC